MNEVDLSSIPVAYLRHVLALHFMIAEGFITKFDADIILLTIRDATEDEIPVDYVYPPIVDPRAFQIAFLFLDFFIDLERSFEAVGLLVLSVRIISSKKVEEYFEEKLFYFRLVKHLKAGGSMTCTESFLPPI